MADDNQDTTIIPVDDAVVIMAEPAKKEPPSGRGQPAIAESQYWDWLGEMTYFLRQGNSLWYAIDKCGLAVHKNVIYAKYKADKEYREKIDAIQATITEINNSVIFKVVENTHKKMIESDKYTPCREEIDMMKLVAEKHRTSQTHWVNRAEVAQSKDEDFGRVIERPIIQIITPEKQLNDKEASQQISQGAQAPGDPIQSDAEAIPSPKPTT